MAKTKIKKHEVPVIGNGFIYPSIDALINLFKYLSLVEGLKYFATRIETKNLTQKINNSRFAVDIFITLKWVFVAILWFFDIRNPWLVGAVWYFLVANLYTYFYYHTWCNSVLTDTYFDLERIKRRFLTLMLAVIYTIFGFAYLYSTPYHSEFAWSDSTITVIKALWFSVSNSLTAGYDQVKPITDLGYSLSMIQLLIMFIFLTIIIGGAIPQPKNFNK